MRGTVPDRTVDRTVEPAERRAKLGDRMNGGRETQGHGDHAGLPRNLTANVQVRA
ncbi:MAG: hypothetical protein HHJ11_19260 [Phycicoccus sp.]|nr:hypothetical protein [Phycicoccus sp.]